MDHRSELTDSARHVTLALTALLHAFTHLYLVLLIPLYFQIEKDFGLQQISRATLLPSLQGLVYCFTGLPIGYFADHWNRKILLVSGLILNALALVAMSRAPSYSVVLVAVVIAGIAGGFYHPAANGLLADLYPNRQGQALGLAGMGASLGFFLGPLTGGLLGQHFGWRFACSTAGILGLLAAVVYLIYAHEVPRQTRPTQEVSVTMSSWSVMGYFALVSLVLSLRDFAGVGTQTFTSLFLQKAHHFGEAKTGFLLGMMSLSSLIANPVFGGLSDGPKRLRWAAFLILMAAFGTISIPWFPRTLVLVGIMWHGIFILASYPVVEAALSESVPARLRSRMFGVVIAVSGMLSNLAHWIMGQIQDLLSETAQTPTTYRPFYLGLGLMIVLSLLALPTLTWVRRKMKGDHSNGKETTDCLSRMR